MLKSDVASRDKYEKSLANKIGRLSTSMRNEAISLLGDPPQISKLDNAFWDKASVELQEVVGPIIEDIALDTATALAEQIPIGIDWGLQNTEAAMWAAQHTFDLVRGINKTSRQAIARAVDRFYIFEGYTIGDVEDSIAKIFGPHRAEMIAVTEVTRAAAQGELFVANSLRKEGVNMIAVWSTNNDSLVCPICGPLNNVQARDGKFHASSGTFTAPPAHVRCRCWLNHTLPPVQDDAGMQEDTITVPRTPTNLLPFPAFVASTTKKDAIQRIRNAVGGGKWSIANNVTSLKALNSILKAILDVQSIAEFGLTRIGLYSGSVGRYSYFRGITAPGRMSLNPKFLKDPEQFTNEHKNSWWWLRDRKIERLEMDLETALGPGQTEAEFAEYFNKLRTELKRLKETKYFSPYFIADDPLYATTVHEVCHAIYFQNPDIERRWVERCFPSNSDYANYPYSNQERRDAYVFLDTAHRVSGYADGESKDDHHELFAEVGEALANNIFVPEDIKQAWLYAVYGGE